LELDDVFIVHCSLLAHQELDDVLIGSTPQPGSPYLELDDVGIAA
jgi:hypothetical protein